MMNDETEAVVNSVKVINKAQASGMDLEPSVSQGYYAEQYNLSTDIAGESSGEARIYDIIRTQGKFVSSGGSISIYDYYKNWWQKTFGGH